METITLGPVPSEEDCAQLSEDNYNYFNQAMSECRRYKAGLTYIFPPPNGADFKVKGNPHDFGTYYEVIAVFNPNEQSHLDWAIKTERNLPSTWEEMEKRVSIIRKTYEKNLY